MNDVVNLEVFPELKLREKPWVFWGVVLSMESGAVIFRNISGEEKGTLIRIPFRYFYDGRVYQKVGEAEDE